MTAVARVEPRKLHPVVQLLHEPASAQLLTPLLPRGVSLDRVASEVFFAVRKEPKIARCTPESIVRSVASALSRGLIIGETIHLVPMQESYKDEEGNWQKRLVCNAWNDYKGDIELVLRTGVAQDITANPVFEHEPFTYREELEPVLRHEPAMDAAARGKLVGAYARARVKFGHYKVKWMPIGDIEKIRAKSKSWGPKVVAECPDWYAAKTAVHAICKQLPKNPRFIELMGTFEEEAAIDSVDHEVVEVNAPGRLAPPAEDFPAPAESAIEPVETLD